VPTVAHLIGDVAESLMSGLGVGLQEGLAQSGGGD
jgi:hypothetical protein